MSLVTVALIVWAFAWAAENAKSQWRHTRDSHAGMISAQHPAWHPRRVRRHANWRAASWWAHEARDFFPSVRRGFAEDREHVRLLREQERLGSEARLAQWRAALAGIRAERAAHTAAARRGETTASFAEWYRQASRPAQQPAASGQQPPASGCEASPPGRETANSAQQSRASGGRPAGLAPPAGTQAGPATGSAPASAQPGGRGETGGRQARRAPASSGQPAGEPHHDPGDGGTSMTMPNGELAGDSPYRAALSAMDGYDRVAQQHEQAAETLEAQLVLHGFDRDPALMEHIRALREIAGTIRAHTGGARQVLIGHHAAGDEYHTSGVDAEASAFRH
jgi:hypothetical protein